MKYSLLFLLLLCKFCVYQSAASKTSDTPEAIWRNSSNHDTARISALRRYASSFPISANEHKESSRVAMELAKRVKDPVYKAHALILASYELGNDTSLLLFDKCYSIYMQHGKYNDAAGALMMKASTHRRNNDLPLALESYKLALNSYQNANNTKGTADCLGEIAFVYIILGDPDNYFRHIQMAIKELKTINASKKIARYHSNISYHFEQQEELDSALYYAKLSLQEFEKQKDTLSIVSVKMALSSIAQRKKEYSKSVAYIDEAISLLPEKDSAQRALYRYVKAEPLSLKGKYQEAIEAASSSARILEKHQRYGPTAVANIYLGNTYLLMGDLGKAMMAFEASMAAIRKLNRTSSTGEVAGSIGKNLFEKGHYKEAIRYLNISIRNSHEGQVDKLTIWEKTYASYKKLGNDKEALKAYENYIAVRDSLRGLENIKALARQEYSYLYKKQAIADSVKQVEENKVKDAELAAQIAESKRLKLEKKKQEQERLYLFGGLVLTLLFGLFIFNRFRVTKKQKGIIEEQKQEVDKAYSELELKNTEIMDSISYAKRIQSAILPPMKLVKEKLENSFIIYEPKDIVAGDFYWMEPQKDLILFAAADCTGHGVPGAMVSVICNNGLNRSVREHSLTDPGEILDKTREIVIAEFEKSEEEVKDGMDIALCSLSGVEGKQVLKYAGANNPLWIIRKGADSIEEIKANKQPIGKYTDPLPYTTHQVELNPGDSIYIFSDGFADQFGGAKGKKFKAANFKRLLLSIQDKNMPEQRELIKNAFQEWMGDFEQLDDVCIIGVRI